ncbi:MAG TPA: alcohol dehydrogenase catalytic domain-containing protein [Solirubrobacterales bacterium]
MSLAARFHGREDVRIEEVGDLEGPPGPGEVRLRITTAAICGSDAAEYARGPILSAVPGPHPVTGHSGPLTIGHEFAGEVIAVGEGVEELELGMLVACGAGVSCGGCRACLQGRTNLCATYATIGVHRDGGLAQYCTVPAAICLDAGAYGLTADAAALAQPMSIAAHALRMGRPEGDDRVLVIGAGGIGAFLTYLAALGGCEELTVVDRSPERLAVAERLGSSAIRLADDPAELEQPSLIYEVSGTAAGLASAFAAAGPGTRIVAVGVQKEPSSLDWRGLTLGEMQVIGTVAHVCAVDLPASLAGLARRSEGWSLLAPTAIPLTAIVEDGLRPLAEGRAERIKTLIDPWIEAPRDADTVPRPAA